MATHVIKTNVTGTVYLVHEIGRQMRAAGEGRILFTGSIAGYMPGSYAAVCNATKASSIRSRSHFATSSRTAASPSLA